MRGPTGGGRVGRGGQPSASTRMQARTGTAALAASLLPLLLALLVLAPIAPASAQTTATTTTPLAQWAHRLGGQHGDDMPKAAVTDAQGATYVAGDFRSGAITVGSKRLVNSLVGKTDVFAVRGG